MSDDSKKNKGGEEEYQFPDDEYLSGETTSSHGAEEKAHEEFAHEEPVSGQARSGGFGTILRIFPFLRNKRVVFVILAAVVVLIIFHFMTRKDVKVVKKAQPVVQQVQQQPQQQPVETQTSPQVTDQLSNLQSQLSNNQNMMTKLQSQMAGLQSALNNMQQQRSDLNKAVSVMADDINKLEMQLRLLQTPKGRRQLQQPLHFTVRAVVPGRAWIKANTGFTESVTIGNMVPQYGRVVSIDPNTGVVKTNAGREIRYGRNDF